MVSSIEAELLRGFGLDFLVESCLGMLVITKQCWQRGLFLFSRDPTKLEV